MQAWPPSCYQLLQLAGCFYVDHVVRNASNAYGTFALVIGLRSGTYLATVFLLGAEINVVVTGRLWPRPLPGGERLHHPIINHTDR